MPLVPNPQPFDPEASPPTLPAGLLNRLLMATACRLMLNTARRFAYPFAPALSRGMGIPLGAVTSVIAANQLAGLLALLAGPLGDRFGYRCMMLTGIGTMGIGMLTGAVFPVFAGVLLAMALAGLGKSLFDPAIQAYVGEKIPYERRALVVGLMEVSWAGSTLLGIPMIGLLIDAAGWRTPFWVLGVGGIGGFLLWARMTRGETMAPRTAFSPSGVFREWRGLARNREAAGMAGFAFLMSAANDNFFVSYGVWFESAFHWKAAALGMGAALIGTAELAGECLTAMVGDRLGKKRSLVAGTAAAAAAYAVLPLGAATLNWALAEIFAIFFFTEFAIVASLSLATEIAPKRRATMMSFYLAAAGIGRVTGALVGGWSWGRGGIHGVSAASTALCLAAVGAFLAGLRGRQIA